MNIPGTAPVVSSCLPVDILGHWMVAPLSAKFVSAGFWSNGVAVVVVGVAAVAGNE